MTRFFSLIGLAVLGLSTAAQATIVNQFAPAPGPGVWGQSLLVGDSSISLPSLAGVGGNLENNQTGGMNGAGRLTTGFDNSYRAEVAIGTSYSASTLMTSGTLGYSYYKTDVAGGNAFAAPTLKLSLLAPDTGTTDGFGQLIYEPSWNQAGGGSQAVPTGDWQTESIGASTGAGADASGGWWWTGGLGIGSSAGGPPIRSLAEWAAAFALSDPDGFATAEIVGVSVGVGTYNQGQDVYFDNVSINVPGVGSVNYDFAAVPEPSAALFGALLTGGLGLSVRRRVNGEAA